MKKISLKESDIKKLEKYPLDNTISTEGTIYYYKKNEDDNNILLKKLYLIDKERVNRKIETIETLGNSEFKKYDELVIPDAIVSIDGRNSGFILKEVMDSITLHHLLEDETISNTRKIKILKDVGKILERAQQEAQEFYFGDLQDNNILVGKEDKISFIDLDSSAVKTNAPLETKYTVIDPKTYSTEKYKMVGGKTYPSKEVDLFCYNTLVLNFLSKFYMGKLSKKEYMNYLSYLEANFLPKEMIDIFRNHYVNKENENVYRYLDNVDYQDEYSYKSFKKKG